MSATTTVCRTIQSHQRTVSQALPEPVRSIQECHDIMTAAGATFELEQREIFGRQLVVYKNAASSLRDYWLRCQKLWSEREYLVMDSERWTYAEVHKRVIVLANMLQSEYGVKKGSKVALLMRNNPEWIVTFWAGQLLGAVIVAVNCWSTSEGLVHCLDISDAVVAIVDQERALQLQSVLAKVKENGLKAVLVQGEAEHPGMASFSALQHKYRESLELPCVDLSADDDATIFFTSGTTGLAKAVLSTSRMFSSGPMSSACNGARNALRRGATIAKPSASAPPRVALLTVPLFHVTGFSFVMAMTSAGGKVVIMPKWNSAEGIRLIKQERVTMTGGVPFIVQEIFERATPADISTIDTISFGGAPAQDGIPSLVTSKLPQASPQQAYGLTETNGSTISHGAEDYRRRPTSTGLPALGCTVKIVGKDGKEVNAGEIGEITVKGAAVFKEYYNDAEATAAAFTADGYFKTGDLASRDHEGFIYIRDRAKDIIIRGGENIAAISVENALYRNPVIQDCAVLGVSDVKLGEVPAAVVVLRSSAAADTTEHNIIEATRQYLPRHAVPIMVIIRTPGNDSGEFRIERNANGKIVKRDLKIVVEQEWQKRQTTAVRLSRASPPRMMPV